MSGVNREASGIKHQTNLSCRWKPLRRVITLILVGAIALLGFGVAIAPGSWAQSGEAQSGDVEQLQQQRQQLEQERQQIQQQRNQIENLEDQAEGRLEGLQDTIESTAERIESNEQQLAEATQKLTQLQDELATAEESFKDRQFSTVGRLRYLQRQQGSQGWAVLLNSQNLNEFLDRRRQLRLLYESDRAILAELKQQADELEQRRQTIERQKNEIALITQELLARKTEYEAQAQEQEKLITRLKDDQQALEAAESRLAADSENLAILIQQRLAAAQGIVRGTGRFVFPANGSITSRFGNRVHPILGYRRFHAGIDFGASYGTTIRAADSGQVIFAGWYGGYGRSVIVNHGGGITTLYAHSSRLLVSEGMTVQQGQAIATVGSSGLSTGPHLHFEVRRNGSPVNPLDYL